MLVIFLLLPAMFAWMLVANAGSKPDRSDARYVRQLEATYEPRMTEERRASINAMTQRKRAQTTVQSSYTPQVFTPPPASPLPPPPGYTPQSQAMTNIEMAYQDSEMVRSNAELSINQMGGTGIGQYLDQANDLVRTIEANLSSVEPSEQGEARQRYRAVTSLRNNIQAYMMRP